MASAKAEVGHPLLSLSNAARFPPRPEIDQQTHKFIRSTLKVPFARAREERDRFEVSEAVPERGAEPRNLKGVRLFARSLEIWKGIITV